jgi:hypothetical protein
MNRTLAMGDMLRNFAGRNPTIWDTHLSAAEFALNNAVDRSIGKSPFFLNYVWLATILCCLSGASWASMFRLRSGLHGALCLGCLLKLAKSCIEAAQQRAADYYYNRNK